VALGVLMNKDNTVKQAGGFIIQLLPEASEEIIRSLEKELGEITSITDLLDRGNTPEMILEHILGEFGLEILEQVPARFYCNCDKARVEKVLISIGKKELQEMIGEGKSIEVNCHFCNKNYEFSIEDLKRLHENS
jgi:molecular chaperone Hsp33